jgi:hypothetical protein
VERKRIRMAHAAFRGLELYLRYGTRSFTNLGQLARWSLTVKQWLTVRINIIKRG